MKMVTATMHMFEAAVERFRVQVIVYNYIIIVEAQEARTIYNEHAAHGNVTRGHTKKGRGAE